MPGTSVPKDEQRSVSSIWIWQARARVGQSEAARYLAWALKSKVMTGVNKRKGRLEQGRVGRVEDGLVPSSW